MEYLRAAFLGCLDGLCAGLRTERELIKKTQRRPVRLIVPDGTDRPVKWLTRIEVRDQSIRGVSGRDYVTVRGERRGSETVYVETSVARLNLKSVIARVTRRPVQNGAIPLRAFGAAWGDGTEIKQVEVQLDGGEWRPATLDPEPRSRFCWVFFAIDLARCRAAHGRLLAGRRRTIQLPSSRTRSHSKTYWKPISNGHARSAVRGWPFSPESKYETT